MENEDKHPLSNWYTEYLKSKKNKTKPPQFPKQTNFTDYKITKIMELKNDTSGTYGFGDVDETPAPDPFIGIEPEIFITKNQEKKLKGLHGFISNNSGGSFHERWIRIDVFIIIPDNLLKDFDYFSFYDLVQLGRNQKIDSFFVFENIKSVLQLIEELNQTNIAYNYQNSEEYWAKISSLYKPERKSLEDESDSYFNKKVTFVSKNNYGVVVFYVGNTKYTYQLDPIDLNKAWKIKDKSPWMAVNIIKNTGSLLNKT